MVALLPATALLAGCATDPVRGNNEFVMMSEAEEMALGRQEHPTILKRYGRYEDQQLQAYVERVGRQLAGKSHRGNLTFTFTLLDSDEVNAFALPAAMFTLQSVHPLSAGERKLAQAARLKIVAVKSGDTIAALAKRSTLKQYAEAVVRLLNGYYPDGEPRPGTLVKIVQ